jgi:hypothetical protein
MSGAPAGSLNRRRRRPGRPCPGGIESRTLRVRLPNMLRAYGAQESDCISRPAATFRRVKVGPVSRFRLAPSHAEARSCGVRSAATPAHQLEAPAPWSSFAALWEARVDRSPETAAKDDRTLLRSRGARSWGGSPVVSWRNVAKRRKCNPVPARHRRAPISGAAPEGCATQFRNEATGLPPSHRFRIGAA